MRAAGYNRPRIRIAPPVRVVAAGVVLQLYKADIPVAVADPWVPVFHRDAAVNGRRGCDLPIRRPDAG